MAIGEDVCRTFEADVKAQKAKAEQENEKIARCAVSLGDYFKGLFSNKHLTDALFSGQREIVLYMLPIGAYSSSGRPLQKRYIMNGVHVREEIDCRQREIKPFSSFEAECKGHAYIPVEGIYCFHRPNAAMALAWQLAHESNGGLTPEDLEQKIKEALEHEAHGAQIEMFS